MSKTIAEDIAISFIQTVGNEINISAFPKVSGIGSLNVGLFNTNSSQDFAFWSSSTKAPSDSDAKLGDDNPSMSQLTPEQWVQVVCINY
jgi:hypothetical protein